jgi:hypothetical protein
MKKLLVLLMTLVLAACSAVGNAMGSQSEIEQNKEKWQDQGITHYRYQLHISCFCVFNEDMPLILEAQDGKVVSMKFQSGKEIDPSLHELFDKYATIDRLFAELEADLSGAADKVTVEYDATYGFPIKADIDFIEAAIDDELYLTISNFEKLP